MALNAAVSRWHEWTGNSLQTWQSQAAAVVVVVVKMLKQQKESAKTDGPEKVADRGKNDEALRTQHSSAADTFFSRQFGLRMCSNNLAPLNDDEQEKKEKEMLSDKANRELNTKTAQHWQVVHRWKCFWPDGKAESIGGGRLTLGKAAANTPTDDADDGQIMECK